MLKTPKVVKTQQPKYLTQTKPSKHSIKTDPFNTSTTSKFSIKSTVKTMNTTNTTTPIKSPIKKKIVNNLIQTKLAQISEELDKDKCRYVVDKFGHSLIYFKHKGRVINFVNLITEVAVGHKSKQEIIQHIRLALLWGIKAGQTIYLYFGDSYNSIHQYLSDISFWKPSKLFQPSSKIDHSWYMSNLVTKRDPNPQQFTPGEYTLIIGVSKPIALSTISKSLQFDHTLFVGIEII